MKQLETIIKNLKNKPEVTALFLTGSHGENSKPYSDIDLVIILDKNIQNISSLYTWIGSTFADVFFFNNSDLERINNVKEIDANIMDGMFVSWLDKGTIEFDKIGKLTDMKSGIIELKNRLSVFKNSKDAALQEINYNYICNKRYFESNDSLYHEALEIRLLYSIPELITGYFAFRNIPWRGEKSAVIYLKQNDLDFYNLFLNYAKEASLENKFSKYSKLVEKVFFNDCKPWLVGEVFPQSKDLLADKNKLEQYWEDLIG